MPAAVTSAADDRLFAAVCSALRAANFPARHALVETRTGEVLRRSGRSGSEIDTLRARRSVGCRRLEQHDDTGQPRLGDDACDALARRAA